MNMRRTGLLRIGSAAVVAAHLAAHPSVVLAQPPAASLRPPVVEIGGGIGWVGQAQAGTRDATMTSNQPGDEPDRFRFFRASGRTRSGPVGSVWVGVNVSSAFGFEGGFHRSRPRVSVDIAGDVEGAPDTTFAISSISQDLVEGNLLYHVNSARFDERKTVPFLLAGVGSFRQRDADEGVEKTGTIYQAGAGFKWLSRIGANGRARGLGMRLDARYVFRNGGFDFEENSRRSFFSASATALIGF